MKTEEFHNFHMAQTPSCQHWKKDGTDEMIGYEYIEKSNSKKGVVVFIPPYINPDDYHSVSNVFENILNKEFNIR